MTTKLYSFNKEQETNSCLDKSHMHRCDDALVFIMFGSSKITWNDDEPVTVL